MARSIHVKEYAQHVWDKDKRVQLLNFDSVTVPLANQHAKRVVNKAGESVCGSTSYKAYCQAEVARINRDPERDAAYYEMHDGERTMCAVFVAPLPGEVPDLESDED